MAVESSIQADDGFFVGEDKDLRFEVEGDVAGLSGWQVEFALYPRRTNDPAPLVVKTQSNGISRGGTTLTVHLVGDDTAVLAGGLYQYVLRRTDPGFRQVLAYGGVNLRDARVAS